MRCAAICTSVIQLTIDISIIGVLFSARTVYTFVYVVSGLITVYMYREGAPGVCIVRLRY